MSSESRQFIDLYSFYIIQAIKINTQFLFLSVNGNNERSGVRRIFSCDCDHPCNTLFVVITIIEYQLGGWRFVLFSDFYVFSD